MPDAGTAAAPTPETTQGQATTPAPMPVRIRAEVSVADPDTCRFVCSQVVHPGGPFAFTTADEAAGSPLPQHLFDLGVVTHVLIAEAVVTVTKRSEVAWGDLRKRIGAVIRDQLTSAAPAVLDSVPDLDGRAGSGPRDEAALRAVVERLFDREVNPRVASHGGHISLVGLEGTTLKIAMGGGCQGCASSQLTLRGSVEVLVQRVAPEITEIVDVTDHAAGTDPYLRGPVRLAPLPTGRSGG